jgi:hypothetical protein
MSEPTKSEIVRDYALEHEIQIRTLPGLDEAIKSIAIWPGRPTRLVYSEERIIEILMETDGMEYEEAREYMTFNTIPGSKAWGELAPLFTE